MSANLCVKSNLRELLEQGYDVTVVNDATAASKIPKLIDGYDVAMTNFNFLASAVVNAMEAIEAMGGDVSENISGVMEVEREGSSNSDEV